MIENRRLFMDQQLLFLESPLCPIAAEVVQNEETVYFYLYDMDFEQERLVTRCACWVKNLVDAPKEIDYARMEEGIPPLMPLANIHEDMSKAKLKSEDLEIIWSKEGHIAALCEHDKVLCILPSCATPAQMPGYCRYCKSNNLLAWELNKENHLLSRIEEAREFWAQDFSKTWAAYLKRYTQDLVRFFGEERACYELNKDAFPNYYLFVFEKGMTRYAFTAGMGLFAMPNTDQYFEDYEKKAYSELAFAWEKDSLSEEEEHEVFAQLGGLANYPWHAIDYIGHGHTVDFKLHEFPYAIFMRNDQLEPHNQLTIESDGVNINWIIPIAKCEFDAMQTEKSNAIMMEIIKEEQRCIYQKRKEA